MKLNRKSVKSYVLFYLKDFLNSNSFWWYTNECFLHRMLNRALRMMKVDIIIKMGFFVRDLHCQIEELHKK